MLIHLFSEGRFGYFTWRRMNFKALKANQIMNQNMVNSFIRVISLRDRGAIYGHGYQIMHVLCEILMISTHLCFDQRYVILWEDMALRFYRSDSRRKVRGKIKVLSYIFVNIGNVGFYTLKLIVFNVFRYKT